MAIKPPPAIGLLQTAWLIFLVKNKINVHQDSLLHNENKLIPVILHIAYAHAIAAQVKNYCN